MQFTTKSLAIFAASLLAVTAAARPSCETGGRWPDAKDCHSFFECGSGGIAVHKTCGPGTAYDSRLNICDYEHKIPSCHGHGPIDHDEPQGHVEVKDNKGEQGHDESKDQGKGKEEHGESKDQGKGKQEQGHGKDEGKGEKEHDEGKDQGKGKEEHGEGKDQGKGQQEHGEGNH
ncbi:hypothetical protein ABOM_007342 [Aspergillus bombycis]|uniref:Chitin-binding type-2 domain-containing protein n=1 Tax=Aspergillus bombycis TaxID=109264 RepID=A0A1F7ZZ84_9EURO|nr:hypothetical protein ABOM_007342 [Aspergillus bombycis]OGM44761.1 hypothetical protein ABOM_007342 [Aspergillus bombycis]